MRGRTKEDSKLTCIALDGKDADIVVRSVAIVELMVYGHMLLGKQAATAEISNIRLVDR